METDNGGAIWLALVAFKIKSSSNTAENAAVFWLSESNRAAAIPSRSTRQDKRPRRHIRRARDQILPADPADSRWRPDRRRHCGCDTRRPASKATASSQRLQRHAESNVKLTGWFKPPA